MKTKNTTKKINKLFFFVIIALVLGLVSFSVYAFVVKPLNDKTNKATDASQSSGTSSSEQQSGVSGANSDGKGTTPNTDVPATPTTNENSSKKQVQMVAFVDQSAEMTYIRGGVNFPVSGGTCYAQLTGPSSQSIRKESAVLPNPASADCKTIAIASSDLAPGKWTFTLNYISDEYEGASVEVSFTI